MILTEILLVHLDTFTVVNLGFSAGRGRHDMILSNFEKKMHEIKKILVARSTTVLA